MSHSDDLDLKRAEILAMFKHGDGEDYWRAVHAVGSLVAELVALRGFRDASLAYLRGPAEERAAVVSWLRGNTCGCYDFADAIERGDHRREEER